MAEKRCMYIGTESGLRVMIHEDGTWRHQGNTFDGKYVNLLAAPRGGGVVYASMVREGLYASHDDGRSWNLIFPGYVQALGLDPSNPGVVYAGTEPVRLFRSEDEGRSWKELEGLQRLPEEVREKWWFPLYPFDGHVKTIFVDWRDPKVICIGLEHGGIYRTVDGGEHWEDLSAGIEYLDIHMVMADPSQANLYYAATARGFYRSEHYGRDWVLSKQGVNRDYFHDFTMLSGPTSTLLITTANGNPPAWMRPGRAESAIFRSNDNGVTWQQLRGGLPESMEHMIWDFVGDPEDQNCLYAGTGHYSPNLSSSDKSDGEVWFSADRGDHWEPVYEGPGPIRSLAIALS